MFAGPVMSEPTLSEVVACNRGRNVRCRFIGKRRPISKELFDPVAHQSLYRKIGDGLSNLGTVGTWREEDG